ncbi:MAG TPA: cell division protein FtsZ [Sphingomonas sp.]|nr:cell division protein FtsZ [Sphingomonas sp.]
MTLEEFDGDKGREVTVIGVGGAGSNAVAALLRQPDHGLRLFCANTDRQALKAVDAAHRLQLGRSLTGGLGAGADPEIGRRAAEEALPDIRRALAGTGLCIIAAGLGGGTGTGAAPVIAAAARDMGAVTIGIAIKPFRFEGTRRARIAATGAAVFEEQADAMVTVCNEHLFRIAGADMTMRDALAASNALVCESASGFARLVSGAALKRVGLPDLRALLAAGGKAVIGYGEHGSGADRALHAARSALCNPLLETVMQSAGRLLVTISGGDDLRLHEVDQAVAWLRDHVEAGADIIWGATTDAALDGRVRIGIAATRLVAPSRVAVVVDQPFARPHRAAIAPAAPPAMAAPLAVAAPVISPAPVLVHRAMEQPGATPPPVPVPSRAPVHVPVPAPPPMELAAAAARQPLPATAMVVEIAEAVPAPSRAAAGVLVLDGEYVVNDRVMRVTGRPAASLADRIYEAIEGGARTLRRGAALHLAA